MEVYLFFGFYPKEQQLNRTMPYGMFDTGTVKAGFLPVGQPLDSSGAGATLFAFIYTIEYSTRLRDVYHVYII